MQKVKNIILIDDNEDDNFFHSRVIKKSDCAETILSFTNAEKALVHLLGLTDSEDFPTVIFLDINMPGMNGWEFMDEFTKNGLGEKMKSIIYILSTSDNPDDIAKADSYKHLAGFRTKPMDYNMLEGICQIHFGMKA